MHVVQDAATPAMIARRAQSNGCDCNCKCHGGTGSSGGSNCNCRCSQPSKSNKVVD